MIAHRLEIAGQVIVDMIRSTHYEGVNFVLTEGLDIILLFSLLITAAYIINTIFCGNYLSMPIPNEALFLLQWSNPLNY